MSKQTYYVYIITNKKKTVLYTGVTNNLQQRLVEHYLNRGDKKTFAGRYHCQNLLFWEDYNYIEDAIAREKQIKRWSRSKKEWIIKQFNPSFSFLNQEIMNWPPSEDELLYRF